MNKILIYFDQMVFEFGKLSQKCQPCDDLVSCRRDAKSSKTLKAICVKNKVGRFSGFFEFIDTFTTVLVFHYL